jgi:aldose 1-epimerase
VPGGDVVFAYDIVNARGTALTVITLGATITSLRVAGRDGVRDDVVLGLADVEGYLERSPYLGCVVGRYANRIARGQFIVDGATGTLAVNDPPNHLHGGVRGFDKRVYDARAVTTGEGRGVRLSRTSPDGEEGYPGDVHFAVRYLLDDDDRVVIDYYATSSSATPFNPTQHSYFNLAGARHSDVLGHELLVVADRYTPVDATLIPTGELAPVAGTPFDFRSPTPVGARIADAHPQLAIARGYDHNYVLDRPARPGVLAHAARLHDPLTGRTLDVHTTEPGLHLYTGNFLDGSLVGRDGRHFGRHAGLCLETQHFPDSPNHPEFPETILRPGRSFHSRTIWQFGLARAP